MKSAVELRRLVDEFDSHVHDAWNKEIKRLERNGDVVNLVLMQECNVGILYDESWDQRMISLVVKGGCSPIGFNEEYCMRNKVKDVLCRILDEE